MPVKQHINAWAGFLMQFAGLLWIIKATMILAGFPQPPVAFEAAPVLFALGLAGLAHYLGNAAGWWGRVALILAYGAVVARLGATLYEFIPGTRISTGDEFVLPYSALVLLGSLAPFISLVLLGIASLRAHAFPSPWHRVPLTVALLSILSMVTAAIHIEVPILLIGVLWMSLGYLIWRTSQPAPPKVPQPL